MGWRVYRRAVALKQLKGRSAELAEVCQQAAALDMPDKLRAQLESLVGEHKDLESLVAGHKERRAATMLQYYRPAGGSEPKLILYYSRPASDRTLQTFMERCGLVGWHPPLAKHLGLKTVDQLTAITAVDLRRMGRAANMKLVRTIASIEPLVCASRVPERELDKIRGG